MRMRSFLITLLVALSCLFGPAVAADPAPDGPGYVMSVDLGDVLDASLDTSVLSISADITLADTGGSSGLPELAAVDSGLSLALLPQTLRSSHYEPSIAIGAVADHVPRLE